MGGPYFCPGDRRLRGTWTETVQQENALLGKWPPPSGGLTGQAGGLIAAVTPLVDAGHCKGVGESASLILGTLSRHG